MNWRISTSQKRGCKTLAWPRAPRRCATIEKRDLAVIFFVFGERCSSFASLDCDLDLRHDLGLWNEYDMSGWNHEDCDARLFV